MNGQHLHELSFAEEYVTDYLRGVQHVVQVVAEIEVSLPGRFVPPVSVQNLTRALAMRELSMLQDMGGSRFDMTVMLIPEEIAAYLALRGRVMARVLAALGLAEGE